MRTRQTVLSLIPGHGQTDRYGCVALAEIQGTGVRGKPVAKTIITPQRYTSGT
jgi:hypothetical protein